MINEPALKDALLALSEQCKTQYLVLSSVSGEVAALREMLRDAIGDRFSATFAQYQAAQIAKTSSIESSAIELLDEIIQRLKDGEVC
jgi:ribosomal protein L16 Arg81 hydroxylase